MTVLRDGQTASHAPILVAAASGEEGVLKIVMTPSVFRQLVVANLVVPFIGLAVEIARSPGTPNAEPFTMSQGILAGIFLLLIVALVAMTIGLCLFTRWSRPTALWLTVAGLAMSVFTDNSYPTAPLAEAIYELSTLLTGAVLAAAYWSPVSRLFEPGSAEQDLADVFS
jgi:hypothetical protein